jgi:hypothetical protein
VFAAVGWTRQLKARHGRSSLPVSQYQPTLQQFGPTAQRGRKEARTTKAAPYRGGSSMLVGLTFSLRFGMSARSERMYKVAEEARLSAERVRVTLEEHTSRHGC